MSHRNLHCIAAAMTVAIILPLQSQAATSGPPAFLEGEIRSTHHGVDNDLLTAGLGQSGLQGAAPTFTDPLNPTATELRRLAIYNNYRALVDVSPGNGFGELYGPTVSAPAEIVQQDGRIAGDEHLAFARTGSGSRVTLMVQIPEHFDPNDACIVTAPSSGSRGIYGAIGTAGEWGLKKGCAVAYTDKGTGTGSHNLETNTVQRIDGTLADADEIGREAIFVARLSAQQRASFTAEFPHRFAFKHAHSQTNPEREWGENMLQSIRFAFHVLNQQYGEPVGQGGNRVTRPALQPSNTLVIASSVSNGGGSSVRAAEQDRDGLIDGVAVSEPNVNPVFDDRFTIVQGNQGPIVEHSRSLLDYTTVITLYQACANLAPSNADAPLNPAVTTPALVPVFTNACNSLHAKNLLSGQDADALAEDAQARINAFQVQPEQNPVQPLQYAASVPQAIAVNYANSYGRFSVTDNLCDFSYAATGGEQVGFAPVPLPDEAEAALFATSNGIPPTGGVNLVYNAAVSGPVNYTAAASPSTGMADFALDGFICLRQLASGERLVEGGPGEGVLRSASRRIAQGIEQIRASGDLGGRPAVFVTGRADAVLPINHTSRPYFGLNRLIEGENSGLRYYEVLNAQHLDILNALPGFNARYIPLHFYFNQAMDLVYDHLRNGTPLPDSQVIRATPRGTELPPLTLANLPAVQAAPPASDRIVFEDGQVRIPE